MITLIGKGVHGGIAKGTLYFIHREETETIEKATDDPHTELSRYRDAVAKAKKQLNTLYLKAQKEIDAESAQIFEIHEMILEDTDYVGAITDAISAHKVRAEYAVNEVSEKIAREFEDMNDGYMQGRAADIRDIGSRLLSILSGRIQKENPLPENAIVCADDLTPSETLRLDRDRVCAFVTARGSVNSHTAILSRSMGIPAVLDVGDDLMTLTDGAEAIVDGFSGKVYISPDKKTVELLNKKIAEDEKRKALLEEYKGLENITVDGRRIEIYANVQSLKELPYAISNDAGGIGLFRSEFIYMDRKELPSEEEQFTVYRTVLEKMEDKKVIIRTLDVGADKKLDYLDIEQEENPALGLRAIRLCLTRPHILATQLRALLRASVYGKLGIMFPMISSEKELTRAMDMVRAVKSQLQCDGIPYSNDVEFGIMIETPAAALISHRLAPLVEFFSIGTNDLSQYTLALDRQNQHLEEFFDAKHEAVMSLIRLTVKNAHDSGKWVGICGELGADTSLTEEFLRMGVDELSVSPSYILPLRDQIRKTDLKNKKGDICDERI